MEDRRPPDSSASTDPAAASESTGSPSAGSPSAGWSASSDAAAEAGAPEPTDIAAEAGASELTDIAQSDTPQRDALLQEWAEERALHRYPVWQWLSIAAIAIGLVLTLAMLGLAQAAAVDRSLRIERSTYLGFLIAGGVLLFGGGLANIGRSLVVRRDLPVTRYRGPSVILLLLLAAALSVAASALFASDAVALTTGEGELTVLGSVVILTSTQVALIIVTLLFVALPDAMPRWPILPGEGLGRSILLGIGLAFPAWVGVSIVAALAAAVLQQLGIPPEPEVSQQVINVANPVIAVIATVVVAPLAEETFFRGVAFTAWSREYGFRRALIASALLFAAIHGSLVALLPIFGLGIALALLYRRTGSLPASMAMHATFNAISVALVLAERFDLIRLT